MRQTRWIAVLIVSGVIVSVACSTSRGRRGDTVSGSTTDVSTDGTDGMDGENPPPTDAMGGDGEGPSDTGESAGSDTAPSDTETPDTETPDTETPDTVTPPPPDSGGPDSGGADGGPPPVDTNQPVDGRLGLPCASDADCACTAVEGCPTTADHLCFSGICTAFCQGTGAAAGACDHVSPESASQVAWGCSSNLTVCLPGVGNGTIAGCRSNDDCSFAPNTVCVGAINTGQPPRLEGVCLPDLGKKSLGTSCSSPGECASGVCLGSGVCSEHCQYDTQCKNGYYCTGLGFSEVAGESPTAWLAGCTANVGSMEPCGSFIDCEAGVESCQTIVDAVTLGPDHRCVEGSGNIGAGDPCSANEQCVNGSCLFQNSSAPYCSGICPDEICPGGMACREVQFHTNGTPNDSSDDPVYGVCISEGSGTPCLEGAPEWCGSGSCDVSADQAPGIGLCE